MIEGYGAEDLVETTVTSLEMRSPPKRPPAPVPLGKFAILRAERPTVSFYRYLYDTIGEPWTWTDRRRMDDETLREIIHDPRVEISVLYAAGVPAGYFELDCRIEGEVELVYLGLIPDFIGRGLGRYLLDCSVATAWTREPGRVWVQTCTLDHPGALSLYQRAGFSPYKQEVEEVVRPEAIR